MSVSFGFQNKVWDPLVSSITKAIPKLDLEDQRLLNAFLEAINVDANINHDNLLALLNGFKEFYNYLDAIDVASPGLPIHNLNPGEVAAALKFAYGRSKQRQLFNMLGEDLNLGGRKPRLPMLASEVKAAWEDGPFSDKFIERCEELERFYPRSTVYEVLKQLCTAQ